MALSRPSLEMTQDARLNFKDENIFGDFINNVSPLFYTIYLTYLKFTIALEAKFKVAGKISISASLNLFCY